MIQRILDAEPCMAQNWLHLDKPFAKRPALKRLGRNWIHRGLCKVEARRKPAMNVAIALAVGIHQGSKALTQYGLGQAIAILCTPTVIPACYPEALPPTEGRGRCAHFS
jgi:hypothetical protein